MDQESPDGVNVSAESFTAGGQDLSRRNAIKYGSIGAGMLLAAPTILTLGATPASASGQVSPQVATASNSGNVTSLVSSEMQSPVGILVATLTVFQNNVTLNAPTGWTALAAGATTGALTTARISSRTFYRYYATKGANTTYTFSWSGGAPASLVINKFPTATTIVENSTPVVSSSGTSRNGGAVTPISNASGSGTILVCVGYARASSSPTPAVPSDTRNTTVSLKYTEAGVARVPNNGSQHFTFFPAANASTGTITLTSMDDGKASVVRVLAIV